VVDLAVVEAAYTEVDLAAVELAQTEVDLQAAVDMETAYIRLINLLVKKFP
jgi:hypothetical protein